MRCVGALEVGERSTDTRRIWKDQEFPVRFNVKPLLMLEPEHGIPIEQLESRVSFFQNAKDRGKFRGFVRGSPNVFKNSNAELIPGRPCPLGGRDPPFPGQWIQRS